MWVIKINSSVKDRAAQTQLILAIPTNLTEPDLLIVAVAYFEIWQLPGRGWVITRKPKSNIFDQSSPLDIAILHQYDSFSIFFLKILAKSRLDMKIFQYI